MIRSTEWVVLLWLINWMVVDGQVMSMWSIYMITTIYFRG